MTMRRTPYERIRYPWTSDTVRAGDVQSMAQDIDQALVQTANLSTSFSRFSSVVVQRANTAQSVAKSVLSVINFDTVVIDNGSDSPLANGSWWAAGSPSRLTAPSPCVVLVSGFVGLNLTGAFGASGAVQCTIALNGASAAPGVQGSKWSPFTSATGVQHSSALSMWKLAAGDFLELKTFWSGTPAGPLNTDTVFPATMSLMMVALPAVP